MYSELEGLMDKTGRRRGFSLIIVLILSLISLAILSVTLQHAVGLGGAGRIASSSAGRYNLLQNSVEIGKAELKRMMNNTDPPPRFPGHDDESFTISAADDLLIDADPSGLGRGVILREDFSSSEFGRSGIAGDRGVLEVKIYDMQYDPTKLAEIGTASGQIAPEALELVPPSLSVLGADNFEVGITTDAPDYDRPSGHGASAKNTGVYLVRATFLVPGTGGFPDKTWTLDTSVIQSNNE